LIIKRPTALRQVGDMIPKVSAMSGSLKLKLCRRKKLRSARETVSDKFDAYVAKQHGSLQRRASRLILHGTEAASLMLIARLP
jgi:hypothetical protein